jgi:hypothetical protein
MNHDQDDYGANESDRVPPLLTVLDPIWDDDVKPIVPNASGEVEGNPVLGEIALAF